MADPRRAKPVEADAHRCPYCGLPLRLDIVYPTGFGRPMHRAQCVQCRIVGFGDTPAEAADLAH